LKSSRFRYKALEFYKKTNIKEVSDKPTSIKYFLDTTALLKEQSKEYYFSHTKVNAHIRHIIQ
jgi:hypothetical protein